MGKPQIPTLKSTSASALQKTPDHLIEVLDLGLMPLANDFVPAGDECAGYAPLKLLWCPRCSLAQLSVVVDPGVLYKHYAYVTSQSQTMKDHFEKLARDLSSECQKGFVVEIGSNDGTLLKFFQEHGFNRVMGVDPAENLCDIALRNGINTANEFFTVSTANDIVSVEGYPDLVIARHVFCHIDDWSQTIEALKRLCARHTVIAIEVPNLANTIENGEWDQIYHEHLSYLTIVSMQAALTGWGLHIHSVRNYPIHGGAIVMLLRRDDCGVEPLPFKMDNITLPDMVDFAERAKNQVDDLAGMVKKLAGEGKTIFGYGASAKATQWIQRCGFTRKHIQCVCDSTVFKQYRLMPGSDIPVVDPGALTRELPDYCVNFAWNFSEEIMSKEVLFKKNGGKWIVPVPKVRIV